jgi:hypothetical protein
MTTMEKVILIAAGGIGVLWLVASKASSGVTENRERRIARLTTGEEEEEDQASPYRPAVDRTPDFLVDFQPGRAVMTSEQRDQLIRDVRAVTETFRYSIRSGQRVWFEIHGPLHLVSAVAGALDAAFMHTAIIDAYTPGEEETRVNGWVQPDYGTAGVVFYEY